MNTTTLKEKTSASLTIGLSDVCNEDVSTYHGALDTSHVEERELETFFEDGSHFDENAFDSDDFWEELDIYQTWKKKMDFTMFDFIRPVLEKYGYRTLNMDMQSPRSYNFEDDSVCIRMSYEGDFEELKETLKDEIIHYIENIRQKSYDGYASFEPNNFEDVSPEDYAIIWAILQKEDIINNEIKDAFEDYRERALEVYETLFSNALYEYCEKNCKTIKSKS